MAKHTAKQTANPKVAAQMSLGRRAGTAALKAQAAGVPLTSVVPTGRKARPAATGKTASK